MSPQPGLVYTIRPCTFYSNLPEEFTEQERSLEADPALFEHVKTLCEAAFDFPNPTKAKIQCSVSESPRRVPRLCIPSDRPGPPLTSNRVRLQSQPPRRGSNSSNKYPRVRQPGPSPGMPFSTLRTASGVKVRFPTASPKSSPRSSPWSSCNSSPRSARISEPSVEAVTPCVSPITIPSIPQEFTGAEDWNFGDVQAASVVPKVVIPDGTAKTPLKESYGKSIEDIRQRRDELNREIANLREKREELLHLKDEEHDTHKRKIEKEMCILNDRLQIHESFVRNSLPTTDIVIDTDHTSRKMPARKENDNILETAAACKNFLDTAHSYRMRHNMCDLSDKTIKETEAACLLFLDTAHRLHHPIMCA